MHSGDSACVIPPLALGETIEAEVRRQTTEIARALGVVGLVNVQYAVQDGRVYVLEANPRASRTVPFVAKATGLPLVEAAVRVALGERVRDLGLPPRRAGHGLGQGGGAAVRPLHRRRRAARAGDALDGRGHGHRAGLRHGVRQGRARRGPAAAAGHAATAPPGVVITVNDRDKPAATLLAQRLHDLGFHIYATSGTARAITQLGTPVEEVSKVSRPDADTIIDLIRDRRVDLIVNTPLGRGARGDGQEIRRAAIAARVPVITTLSGRLGGGAGDRAGLERRGQAAAGAAARRGARGRAVSAAPATGCARVVDARVAGVRDVGAYRLVRLEGEELEAPAPGRFAMARDPAGAAFLPRPVGPFALDGGGVGVLVDPSLRRSGRWRRRAS